MQPSQETKLTARVPVWFEGKDWELKFAYEAERLGELWSELVLRGGSQATCRMWLYAGVDLEDAELLFQLLADPEMVGFEEILMDRVLERMDTSRNDIGCQLLH